MLNYQPIQQHDHIVSWNFFGFLIFIIEKNALLHPTNSPEVQAKSLIVRGTSSELSNQNIFRFCIDLISRRIYF